MKKKFSRSLSLNKKSVAKLGLKMQGKLNGGNARANTGNWLCETGYDCIPDTVEPSCAGTCWYSDCNCTGDDGYTGANGWGDCS